MNNKILYSIDKFDEIMDNLVIPISKGIISNNEYFNYYLTVKTTLINRKIVLFLDAIKESNNEEISSFIGKLNDEEKTLFLEVISKVMDLDDNFQIFLSAHLFKQFKKNGSLNYWEKTLYYNIKLFSDDDYMLLYDFVSELSQPLKFDKNYGIEKDNIELSLTIRKFENIGILAQHVGSFAAEPINLKEKGYSFAFKVFPYIQNLYTLIDEYKKSISISPS